MAGPGVPSCPLVLGVDGGGTGTTCHAHILDPTGGGRTLATGVGEGGSANANSVGFDVAVRAVTTAALAALRHLGFDDDASRALLESGVAPLPTSSAFDFPREVVPAIPHGSTAPIGEVRLRAACACLAGCDAPEDRLRWRDALRLAIPGLRADLDPSLLVVDNDAVAALASGSHRPNLPDHQLDDDDAGDPVGVVLVAGTGTVAFAVRADPDRTRARTAGWGPAFDDVGSGHWIGSRALAAVARAVDGRGPKTSTRWRGESSTMRARDSSDRSRRS
jgi:N-acetylglucosamine kinase-like BadF-type ATPase